MQLFSSSQTRELTVPLLSMLREGSLLLLYVLIEKFLKSFSVFSTYQKLAVAICYSLIANITSCLTLKFKKPMVVLESPVFPHHMAQ
jgi:hypothetical protein